MNPMVRLRLEHAEQLLGSRRLPGAWPRCVAWLTRLALEQALDDLWAARAPSLREAPKRTQLLALSVVVDETVQQRATHLWDRLSRAGHHHHYELAPTVGELREWLLEVRGLATTLVGSS